MLSAWILSAVLSFAPDPAVLPSQDGEWRDVDQDIQRAANSAPSRMKLYEVRDIAEGMARGWSADEPDAARDDLEFRIRSYIEQKRASNGGIEYVSQLASFDHEQRVADGSKELARIVRQYMLPAFEPDKCSIKNSPGALVVSASEAQLAWVEAFLDRQRAATNMIEIEARFLVGARGCFEVLGDQTRWTFADKAQLDTALATVTSPLEVLIAPRLTVLNLTPASMSVTDQIAYVQDYDVRVVEPGSRQIAVPVIQTIDDGTFIKARAFELDDGTYGVSVETTLAKLKRPIQASKVTLQINGAAQEVQIALPAVEIVRFKGDAQVKNGGSAIFVFPCHDDRDLALIVTVRRGPAAPPTAPGPERR